jgi:ABC-type multidrug transport system ATPase subunit
VASGKSPAVLQVHGLDFAYPRQPTLFSNWSLDLPSGVTWVGGDESTGKTTLLRLLAGELQPQSGSLRLGDGTTLAGDRAAYQRQLAWADPRSGAFDAFTPPAYWNRLRTRYPGWDAELLTDLMAGLALEPHLPKTLCMLSTGTKRKVFLAGALASGTAVTLLDEPFAALDRASIAMVLEFLREASGHRTRSWVVADYEAPRGVGLAATYKIGQ